MRTKELIKIIKQYRAGQVTERRYEAAKELLARRLTRLGITFDVV